MENLAASTGYQLSRNNLTETCGFWATAPSGLIIQQQRRRRTSWKNCANGAPSQRIRRRMEIQLLHHNNYIQNSKGEYLIKPIKKE